MATRTDSHLCHIIDLCEGLVDRLLHMVASWFSQSPEYKFPSLK